MIAENEAVRPAFKASSDRFAKVRFFNKKAPERAKAYTLHKPVPAARKKVNLGDA